MEQAEALGYATFAARGSRGLIDCLCFEAETDEPMDLRPLAVQVGTTGKTISKTLEALDEAPRPIGSLCMVARLHRRGRGVKAKWTFHTFLGKYDSLEDAIKYGSPHA
jgi:hypothetical protein